MCICILSSPLTLRNRFTVGLLCCFLCAVTPHTQCRLKLLKQERIKDYLLMEEEFIRNQEQMKPLEEKQEVCAWDDCFA